MSRYTSVAFFLALLSLWSSSILSVFASPYLPLPTQFRYLNEFAPASPRSEASLASRADGEPQFPDQPPSCPICAQNFDSIDSCAQAAPVLQNFTMVSQSPWSYNRMSKGSEGTCSGWPLGSASALSPLTKGMLRAESSSQFGSHAGLCDHPVNMQAVVSRSVPFTQLPLAPGCVASPTSRQDICISLHQTSIVVAICCVSVCDRG